MTNRQLNICSSDLLRTTLKFYHSERKMIFNVETIYFNEVLPKVKVKETGEIFSHKIDGIILHPVCINEDKDIIYEYDVIEFIRYDFVKYANGVFYIDEDDYKEKTGRDDFYEDRFFCEVRYREIVKYDNKTGLYYYDNMIGLDCQVDIPIFMTKRVGSYLTNPELLDDYKHKVLCDSSGDDDFTQEEIDEIVKRREAVRNGEETIKYEL